MSTLKAGSFLWLVRKKKSEIYVLTFIWGTAFEEHMARNCGQSNSSNNLNELEALSPDEKYSPGQTP